MVNIYKMCCENLVVLKANIFRLRTDRIRYQDRQYYASRRLLLLGGGFLGSWLLGCRFLGSGLLGSRLLGSRFLGSRLLGSRLLSSLLGGGLLCLGFLGGRLLSLRLLGLGFLDLLSLLSELVRSSSLTGSLGHLEVTSCNGTLQGHAEVDSSLGGIYLV